MEFFVVINIHGRFNVRDMDNLIGQLTNIYTCLISNGWLRKDLGAVQVIFLVSYSKDGN